jgi:competence protein ComEA
MNRRTMARGAFLAIAAFFVLFVVYSVLKRPESTPLMAPITLRPLPTNASTTTMPTTLSVYVTGAVKQPDVYTLPPGSNVKNAIAAAGGATADADLDQINLALHLTDQMHIHVPRIGEAAPPPSTGDPASGAPGELININTASAAQLDTLPGIGPTIAQAIIDYRTQNGPFKKIDNIKDVKGIGDSLFGKIKDLITVGP